MWPSTLDSNPGQYIIIHLSFMYIYLYYHHLCFPSIFCIIYLSYLSITSLYTVELQDIRTMHEAKPVIKGTYLRIGALHIGVFHLKKPSSVTVYLKQLSDFNKFLIVVFSTINIIVYHHLYRINSHILSLFYT